MQPVEVTSPGPGAPVTTGPPPPGAPTALVRPARPAARARRRAHILSLYCVVLATTSLVYILPQRSPLYGSDPAPPARVSPSRLPDAPRTVPTLGTSGAAPSPLFPLLDPKPPRLPTRPPAAPAATAVAPTPLPVVPELATDAAGEPKRIRVRDRAGRTVVARVYGGKGDETHVMLPDGELGIPDGLTYTDEPFRPFGPEEVAASLLSGPLAHFKLKATPHYLVFYRSSDAFAEESARVLEGLYARLLDALRRRGFPVHEAEFPLVAVIFATERDFQDFREVDPQVRAYYEIYTNRIYFYETSERDEAAPEVAAVRRPQTVAHEGTHQILQNVGVQPRLAAWPPWLVEGLAEYYATPLATRKGPSWSVFGSANAQHLATIRDLADPAAGQFLGEGRPVRLGRARGQSLAGYVVTKADLSPTDYAYAWALTHYLALKRSDDFLAYLDALSRMSPLVPVTPEEHLASFRAAFGGDLSRLDRDINRHLGKLKPANRLPYYAVVFEQSIPGDLVKRAAVVSQSPSMIRQWLAAVTTPRGASPSWQVLEFATRTPALAAAEVFVRDP